MVVARADGSRKPSQTDPDARINVEFMFFGHLRDALGAKGLHISVSFACCQGGHTVVGIARARQANCSIGFVKDWFANVGVRMQNFIPILSVFHTIQG